MIEEAEPLPVDCCDRVVLPLAGPTSSHMLNGMGKEMILRLLPKGIRQENQLAVLGTQVTPIYTIQESSHAQGRILATTNASHMRMGPKESRGVIRTHS